MRAEVRYLDALPFARDYRYAFEVPEGTVVGEQFLDGEKIVEVTALDSSYDGPVRGLFHATKQAQTPGGAATPAPAPPHRGGKRGTP